MFIGWINQMMAIMDKPEGKAVRGIVSEIAKRYPQVNLAFLFLSPEDNLQIVVLLQL